MLLCDDNSRYFVNAYEQSTLLSESTWSEVTNGGDDEKDEGSSVVTEVAHA